MSPLTVSCRRFPLARSMSATPAFNPFAPVLSPADAFQLLPESKKAGEAEDALYDAELKEVEAWWSTPRFAGIKRPYGAADVVSKRGTQKIHYPSSVMAAKLFNLIRERESRGEPIHTSKSQPKPRFSSSGIVHQPLPPPLTTNKARAAFLTS